MSQSGLNYNIPIQATLAYGARLNALAESIANVEAVAGRNVDVLLTGSLSSSGGNFLNSQATNPIGDVYALKATRIRYLDQVASPVPSACPTNFTILGNGWTINKSTSGIIGFCRDGTYELNNQNHLMNSSGQLLQVYLTDQTGAPLPGVDPTSLDSVSTLDLTNIALQSNPTTQITAAGLLPGNNPVPGLQHTNTLDIIDSLGVTQHLTLSWTKSSAAPRSTGGVDVWTLSVKDPNNVTQSITNYQDLGTTTTTDSNGNTVSIPAGGNVFAEFNDQGTLLGFYNGSSSTTLLSAPPPLGVTWDDNAAASNITVNLGTPGQKDGIALGGGHFKLNRIQSNGYIAGDVSSFEITPDGYGVVNYNNAQSIIYCRIPLVTFNATNQLLEKSSGVFVDTYASGTPLISFPGQSGIGTLVTGTREGSSANQTQIYLNMINTQNSYMGNLKTIEVIKELNQRLMQV